MRNSPPWGQVDCDRESELGALDDKDGNGSTTGSSKLRVFGPFLLVLASQINPNQPNPNPGLVGAWPGPRPSPQGEITA